MAINLGSCNSDGTRASGQRKIVKTSVGKLIFFTRGDAPNYIQYKISSDNGATWDGSWTNVLDNWAITDFSVYIDTNNDIFIIANKGADSMPYFIKMTYGGGSWTIAEPVQISTNRMDFGTFAKRSNGDLWVGGENGGSQYINCAYSSDGGSTWNNITQLNIGQFCNSVNIIAKGTYIWLIVQRNFNSDLAYYQYDTSWSAATVIGTSITNESYWTVPIVKMSDSEIYTAARTSSGIKVFKYDGSSWNSGTLLTDNASDSNPVLSNQGGLPILIWRDYTGSEYNISFRRWSPRHATWEYQINITQGANAENYPTAIDYDYPELSIGWVYNSESYFQKISEYKFDCVPSMEGETNPAGTVTKSSEVNIWNTAWQLFDDDLPGIGTPPNAWLANGVTGWVAYQFVAAKIITRYTIFPDSRDITYAPKNWTFEGWNGSSWDILDTKTGITDWVIGVKKEFPISNTTAYTKYKIDITLNNGSGSYVGFIELELLEDIDETEFVLFNSNFENWTTPGNPGTNTSGTLPNWIAYSVNNGTATRISQPYHYFGLYACNICSNNLGNITSIGGIISDAFFFNKKYLNWYQKDQHINVAPTVRILDADNGDAILASYSIAPSTSYRKISWDISSYSGKNLKVRFEQHTTSEGSGYATAIDFVTISGVALTQYQIIYSSAIIQTSENQETINSSAKIVLVNFQKSILSLANIIIAGLQNISFSATIKVIGQQQEVDSDANIVYGHSEVAMLSDATIKKINANNINSASYIIRAYESKFIRGNDLFITTNSTPANIIKVDIQGVPSWTIYPMASGRNKAQDLVLNFITKYLYTSCDLGLVIKADLNSPSSMTVFDVGESKQLKTITSLTDYQYTYIGANPTGELFVLDESTKRFINTDIRFVRTLQKLFHNFISFIHGFRIKTDIRFFSIIKRLVKADIRFILDEYDDIVPFAREDFIVKIDNVQNDNVKLDSIKINKTIDSKPTASFILTRYHDKINYDLNNSYRPITNQNNIKIYLKTNLLFEGKVSNLRVSSSAEEVEVFAEGVIPTLENTNTSLKNLPLTLPNARIHLYDVLLDDIEIDNPDIDPDEENPKYFKGIKVHLGKQEGDSIVTEELRPFGLFDEEDYENFVPEPNMEYFWTVSVYNFITGEEYRFKYIGTSLAPISSDAYQFTAIGWIKQRISHVIIKEDEEYTLGTAPYKEISTKNGTYFTFHKYEDREDGLYDVLPSHYDFINWAKKVANVEYQKIKNINGSILPVTRANIKLTLDGHLFYGLQLLHRINLINTTETNIYNNNNGFPLSIKQISIDSSDMSVNLVTDNQWSNLELEKINEQLGTEPEVIPEFAWKIADKFDLNFKDYID